ncbi:hypothetical protein B1R94_19030 [Mycolicibacterium litorale]|nr:hypothetical protein B1R94_19030 [Mycolicibacterium litorale]
MAVLGERAVVLGSSMAGMLAARVAAEHYRTVTVIDRDMPPAQPLNRRGVPQGRHGHVLQAGGAAVVDELFPGILAELAADGSPVWDDGDLARVLLEYGGHTFVRSGRMAGLTASYLPSRAFLDWHVLQRLSMLPNVTVLGGHDVVGLTSSQDSRRVTGVLLAGRDVATNSVLGADLVIDATGRGSRVPFFLEQLGFDPPTEDELVVNLAYTSQWLQVAPGAIAEHMVAMFPRPGDLSTVALIGHENGSWLMTVGAMAGQQPADSFADMLVIALRRVPAHIRAALLDAEPVGKTAHYRVPSSRWRRYDRLVRFPDGLVVTGDAVCSFNPIYGQGMSVAALDAVALRRCLHRGDRDLPHRFHQASAKAIAVAWRSAVNADLALPEVAGQRPIGTRLSIRFLDRVLTAIETDQVVAEQFFRVTGMLDAPTRLMRPSILARVLRANLARPRPVEQPELSLAG